jgi:hypothetical protein
MYSEDVKENSRDAESALYQLCEAPRPEGAGLPG